MAIPSVSTRAAIAASIALAGSALAGVGPPPPHYTNETGSWEFGYAVLQWPPSITVPTGANTGNIYGQIWGGPWTEPAGPNGQIVAQLGYGPAGSNPLADDSGWTWITAAFNVQVGNNDEYFASFTAPAPGTYAYTYRFAFLTAHADANVGWTLADLDGAGSNGGLEFSPSQLGLLTVTPTPGAAAVLGLGAFAGLRRRR